MTDLAAHMISKIEGHTNRALAEQKSTLEINHKNILEGTIRRLSKAIQLELDEMKVYLDRPSPNLEGVMNRIKDIEGLIRG